MNRIKAMWERVATQQAEGSPGGMTLQWHVTERCDLRCAHCYQEDPAPPELDLATMFAILGQFRHLLRRRADGGLWRGHVTLSGGEPFLRPDLGRIIDRLVSQRSWTGFSIETHGGHIAPRRARWLALRDPAFVQVSLDGLEETHDRTRGAGSFARAVQGIEDLVRAGVRTVIAFTAHRDNYGEFPEVAELGSRLGAARVWAERHVPCGRGRQMEPLTPDETRRLFRSLCRAREKTRSRGSHTRIALHHSLQFLDSGGPPYRCAAGDTTLAVMPDGTVYPCRRMPIAVGNVKEIPLARLYEESRALRALRDRARRPAGCVSCAHVESCGGGLRCLSHAVTGSPFRADPGCPLAVRKTAAAGMDRVSRAPARQPSEKP